MAVSSRGLLGAANPYLDPYAQGQQRLIEDLMRAGQYAAAAQCAGQNYQQLCGEQPSADNLVLLLLE